MKKNLFAILLLIIATTSCERDDICIDPITPKFTLRFYDSEEPDSFKDISQLSVKVIGVENDSIRFTGMDSIYIPLNVVENTTKYVLTINSTGDSTVDETIKLNRDTITVNYATEDVFIGRSCGFKSVFNTIEYILTDDGDNWIQRFEIVTTTIDNESSAHVKIFH